MAPIATSASFGRLSPPVWRILLHSVLFGLALSIADLLFNFYLASLGYAADTAGLLSTVGRAAGMLLGLPFGMLIDRLGPQPTTLIGVIGFCGGWLILLLASQLGTLIIGQFIVGASFLLASTALTPLLAAVTHEDERAGIFGLNASVTMMVGLLGSALGGVLPRLAGTTLGVGAQETAAYRLALGMVVGLGVVAMLPLTRRFPVVEEAQRRGPGVAPSTRLPFSRLLRFALAGFLLGIGGGMILPFQNLFFRYQFGLNDSAVGITLAVASLGMGLGALLGAPLTARIGLRRSAATLRFCAAGGVLLMLSPLLIPAIMGFFLRGLFIAASFPQNDALVVRHTPPPQRGLAVSLMSVLWSGGWALAAVISGVVQIRWGFTPIIISVAITYALSALAIITLRLNE